MPDRPTAACATCTTEDHRHAHLAIDDIEVLIGKVAKDFIDIVLLIELQQSAEKVPPVTAGNT